MDERLARANEGLKTVRIKGKDYVMVKDRLAAFRREFPEYRLMVDVQEWREDEILMCATIYGEDGTAIAQDYAHEIKSSSGVNSTSYIENASTSAIGRVLACFGIGIDDSYASANEVEQAIKKQNQQALTRQEVARLIKVVQSGENCGEDEAVLFIKEVTGKESSALLTGDDYAKVVGALKE